MTGVDEALVARDDGADYEAAVAEALKLVKFARFDEARERLQALDGVAPGDARISFAHGLIAQRTGAIGDAIGLDMDTVGVRALQADGGLGKYQPNVDILLSNVCGMPIGGDVVGSYTKYALSLVWDISGYALLPHADDPRVIFNFLFYLPAPGEESAFGTSIYLPKDRAFLSSGEARHQRHEFEHVSTYPFKQNAMFSFMRTARSFHGVEPVTGEDSVRRLILFSIRIDEEMMPDRADEVAELVPA